MLTASWAREFGNVSDGTHVFTATATDAAGNTSAPSAPRGHVRRGPDRTDGRRAVAAGADHVHVRGHRERRLVRVPARRAVRRQRLRPLHLAARLPRPAGRATTASRCARSTPRATTPTRRRRRSRSRRRRATPTYPDSTPAPPRRPLPVAPPTPTPQAGETVVVRPSSGKILVRRPGSTEFVEITRSSAIPLGSEIDARKGRVVLTAEPVDGKPVERATFYAGLFIVRQVGGYVELTLSEELAPCKKKQASAAAAKPKSRKLWGDGKGKFRTKGQYSSATDPRHQVARRGLLRRDAHAGRPGRRLGARRPQAQDGPAARRAEATSPSRSASGARMTRPFGSCPAVRDPVRVACRWACAP